MESETLILIVAFYAIFGTGFIIGAVASYIFLLLKGLDSKLNQQEKHRKKSKEHQSKKE